MKKSELIEEIQNLAKFWEASIAYAAMDVIHNPDVTEKMAEAQELLMKNSERLSMASSLIGFINLKWTEGPPE